MIGLLGDTRPLVPPVGSDEDATRHVAFGVVERTKGAKGVLFAEMTEARISSGCRSLNICQPVHNIDDVVPLM